jgi:hypothetical protein
MPQLRDDAQRVLVQTYPDGKYTLPTDRPWWKFWQRDEVIQLLQHSTVPKAKADEGGIPPP